MDKRIILLLIAVLVGAVAISSFLLIELVRLNNELTALKREYGEYWYDWLGWVTKFVGYSPITSAEQAKETYLMLVDKAPRKSYWIIYFPEDNGLPLKLETLEMDSYYKVNGTFRNFAVNCIDAKLEIVYSIFKNGTATLENVQTKCSEYEYQNYP